MHTTYKFNRPYNADGSPTKWKQVVDYIVANGSVNKHMIIKEVWPDAPKWIVERGWCSTLFAALNKYHPDVRYNVHTKEWESTAYAHKQVEKQHKKILRNSKYGTKDVADSFFGELHSMMDKLPLPKFEKPSGRVEDVKSRSFDNMKTLIEVYDANHTSVTVLWNVNGEPTRFKLTSWNGNCYSHVNIDIMTKSLEYKTIYSDSDIPGVLSVRYYDNDDNRIRLNKVNIEACKKLIQKVF